MKMQNLVLATLVLAGTISAQPTSDNLRGTISGTVLAEDGKPLGSATIFALPEQDMRRQIRTTADANGNFVLPALPAGNVYLDAFKEGDGYPYNFFAFFKAPGELTPIFNITPGQNLKGVVIKLGPRAAALAVEITQLDGAPITGPAELAFTRNDIAGPYTVGAKSHHTMLVPSAVSFRFSVAVPGYKAWNSQLITGVPGETLTFAVHLEKQ